MTTDRDNTLDEIYPDSARKCAICPCILDITPIVGQPALHVVVHTPSGTEDAIGTPADFIVETVGIVSCAVIF